MSSGLYSGQPGLSLGTGLYRTVSGLWSGASGLTMAFGGAGMPLSLNFLTMTAYTLDPRITFSRGSQAMVTDATGKLTYAPNNLLLNSEEFENANWSKTSVTISSNTTTAPNGTTTADTLTASAGAATHNIGQNNSVAGYTGVWSIYCKAGTQNFIQLFHGANSNIFANFNLSSGTVGTTGSLVTASMTSVGGGWYRCSIAFAPPTPSLARIALVTSASAVFAESWTATGTETVYIWGAQLEAVTYQTTPRPYVSTTPKNLLGYTQEFDNAAWTKSNASVTPNAVAAPDGSLTADKLVEDTTATVNHYVRSTGVAIVAGGYVTYSLYAKAAERSWIYLTNASYGNYAYFNVSSGAVGATLNCTASITAVGNGWYRCAITMPTNAGTQQFDARLASANGIIVYTGDGTSGIYIWGAQLSNSASVDPYVYNPVAAPSSTAYYGPRFDYDPVTLAPRGLLIEEQRTNLLVYSEDISQTAWAKTNVTVGATSITSPSGGTANSVSATSLGSFLEFYQDATVTAGAVYTYSAFLHPSVSVSGTLRVRDVATVSNRADVDFNLTNKTAVVNVYGTYTNGSVKIIERFDGFFRVEMTFTVGSNTSVKAGLYQTSVFSGGIYLWGAQLEAGSFATSYIPTVASTVTRSADVALMQGANFSNWYNAAAGSFIAEITSFGGAVVARALTAIGASPAEQIAIGADVTRVRTGGVDIGAFYTATILTGKRAVAYASDQQAAANNGAALSSANAGLPSGIATFYIGSSATGSQLSGWARSIQYFNTRLPNLQLQALTS